MKIENYENYEVRPNGEVINTKTGRVLKSLKDTSGYLKVCLCKNGKPKMFLIHRLVAETFIPNPDNLPCVNHKDEDKTNNWATNLEWCTHKYNNNYGTAIKRKILSQSKPILQFSRNGEFIKEWESCQYVAKHKGWKQCDINQCCLGKRKTAYNYIWKFKEL